MRCHFPIAWALRASAAVAIFSPGTGNFSGVEVLSTVEGRASVEARGRLTATDGRLPRADIAGSGSSAPSFISGMISGSASLSSI